MSAEPVVGLVLGTHTWAPGSDDKIKAMVDVARKHGVSALDTARTYGPSEGVIGRMGLPSEFAIDTKVPTGFVPGAAAKIAQLADESFAALETDKVRTYFLHGPDETVPLSQQMDEIQKLYEQGRFERFGVSNLTQDQFVRLHDYARARGYVLPTVYQSSYSAAVRGNEAGLFPALRARGVSLQAYSPMAAGLLAKTPEYIEQGRGSWDPQTPSGRLYRDMYHKPSYMAMLRRLADLSRESGISRSGLAYRWVRHHSALQGALGDEMIVGASSADMLRETLDELARGPLPPSVAAAVDELWGMVQQDAPTDNFESFKKVFL